MPPKRRPRGGGSAKTSAPTNAAPPSSEDAKPNVDALNAEPAPPSDPLAVETDPSADAANPEASTATSPPARRLDTLNQSTRGSPATRGKKVASTPRFAGRRSQAQREELRKAEEERKKAEEASTRKPAAADASRASRGYNAGRYSSGRGMGNRRGLPYEGYSGRGGRGASVASGPFSLGEVSEEIRQLNRRHSRRSGWSGFRAGPTRSTEREVSQSTRSHATNTATAKDKGVAQQDAGPSTDVKPILDANGDVSMGGPSEGNTIDGGYISSDEEEDKGFRRMNVEELSHIDLTQDDADLDYAPVRVARVAHKERTLGINADGVTNEEGAITVDANDVAAIAGSGRKRSKQKAKEVEITGEKKGFQGVFSESESDAEPEPRIKPDPEGDDERVGTPEPMPVQSPDDEPLPQEPPSSPETKRKGKERIKARAFSSDSMTEMPDYQTREELEEWERHQRDLVLVRSELGQPATNALDDGDAAMTDSQLQDDRKDKVYLFQFPPVLPDLLPIKVKPDPDAANGVADMMELDPPSNANNPITIQDDGKAEPQGPKFPSGAVGKLKVHASGKVTLDWGGTSLSLGMGTEATFLQDVLLATLPDRKAGVEPGDSSAETGQAVSMGQVKSKFVVTPDWEELLS